MERELMRRDGKVGVATVVTVVLFGAFGFFSLALYGYHSSWWDSRGDEEIREFLRSNNPGFADNETLTEGAVAEAARSPAWESLAIPSADRREVPSPESVGVAGDGDARWLEFERTSLYLVDALANGQDVAAADLFRNRYLNPADDYVPPESRAVLESWLVVKQPVLARLKKVIFEVSAQELDFMIERGVARSVLYSSIQDAKSPEDKADELSQLESLRASLTQAGATPAEIEAALRDTKIFDDSTVTAGSFCYATRRGDERIYLGDLRRMPQTISAAEAYHAAVMEFYSGVLRFFRQHGSLTEADERRMLDRIDAVMARYLP